MEEALVALDVAAMAARSGDYKAACSAAQAARTAAEAAFSNPAILSQLSFPQSHLVGVYVPLFLPIGMTLLQGMVIELKRLYTKKKQ